MKKVLFVFVVLSFFVAFSSLSKAEATQKIGVVDMVKALNESDYGKKSIAEIENMKKSRQATIDEKGKRIEQLKAELDKQASVLSAEAKKSKEEEIERLIREFQRLVSDATAELQKKQREVEVEMIKDLRAIISKLGEDEKFTLIVEASEGGVYYFDKAIDITDKVIKRFNEVKKK